MYIILSSSMERQLRSDIWFRFTNTRHGVTALQEKTRRFVPLGNSGTPARQSCSTSSTTASIYFLSAGWAPRGNGWITWFSQSLSDTAICLRRHINCFGFSAGKHCVLLRSIMLPYIVFPLPRGSRLLLRYQNDDACQKRRPKLHNECFSQCVCTGSWQEIAEQEHSGASIRFLDLLTVKRRMNRKKTAQWGKLFFGVTLN